MPFTQKNNRGRPSAVKEQIRKAVIEKSWEILDTYLKGNAKTENKIKIALEIAKRSIPVEVGGLGGKPIAISNVFTNDIQASNRNAQDSEVKETP